MASLRKQRKIQERKKNKLLFKKRVKSISIAQRVKDIKQKKFRAEIKEILGFDKLKIKRKNYVYNW